MNKYSVKTNQYNYILCEHKTSANGKEYESILSYHASLDALFNRIVDLEIKEYINEPVGELLQLQERMKLEITNIMMTLRSAK